MSSEKPILFRAQRYSDGTYYAMAYDPDRDLVSGVRTGRTLEEALHSAANCGHWYVIEWRNYPPDGEKWGIMPPSESTIENAVRIARTSRRRDGTLVCTIQISLTEQGEIDNKRFQDEVDLKEAILRSRPAK